MNENEFIHEMERRKLWLSTFETYIKGGCVRTGSAVYADEALAEFDKRFKVIEFNNTEENDGR